MAAAASEADGQWRRSEREPAEEERKNRHPEGRRAVRAAAAAAPRRRTVTHPDTAAPPCEAETLAQRRHSTTTVRQKGGGTLGRRRGGLVVVAAAPRCGPHQGLLMGGWGRLTLHHHRPRGWEPNERAGLAGKHRVRMRMPAEGRGARRKRRMRWPKQSGGGGGMGDEEVGNGPQAGAERDGKPDRAQTYSHESSPTRPHDVPLPRDSRDQSVLPSVEWGPRLTNGMTHTKTRDLVAVLGYGTGALGSSTAAKAQEETKRRPPLHQAGHVELLV